MGIEDRDYFRDDYARKNGMRYNARNSTYTKKVITDRVESGPEHLPPNEFGFVGKLLISLAVAVICAAVWRYLR